MGEGCGWDMGGKRAPWERGMVCCAALFAVSWRGLWRTVVLRTSVSRIRYVDVSRDVPFHATTVHSPKGLHDVQSASLLLTALLSAILLVSRIY
jgi:hypothetical protein